MRSCDRVLIVPLLILAAVGCGPSAKPDPRKFVLAGPARPAAFTRGCDGDVECPDRVCASKKCDTTSHTCTYALAGGATCPCYQDDIRWCSPGTKQVQFCVADDDASTHWQAECGPTQVPCDTMRAACHAGTRPTVYSMETHAWIDSPDTACTADPPCPPEGSQRRCDTGRPECSVGLQTFRGDDWLLECAPIGSCDVPVVPPPPPPPPCNPAKGSACGCGGTIDCQGNCSSPGPANLGQGCTAHCGGTFQCDGSCSRHERVLHTFDGQDRAPFGCGHSYNRLKGSRTCGDHGELRVGQPSVSKIEGGNSHCELVTWDGLVWANEVCGNDPNHAWGNSNIRDACNEYFAQGATNPADQTDCRYIIHGGTGGCDGLVCDLGHDTTFCE